MQDKMKLANEEIKKVIGFISENEKAFDYMDLKLHKVSYYCYSQMNNDFPLLYKESQSDEYSYFNMFCEDSYRGFVEDMQESYKIDFDKMRHQLGRTSSFYLHDRNVIDIDVNRLYYKNTIYNLLYTLNNYNVYLEDNLLETGLIDETKEIKEEWMEETQVELEYITNELYKDTVSYCEDIIKVYESIKSFKENQVEYFKEFLQYYQDEAEEEARQAKEDEENAIETVLQVVLKYNISSDDLEILSTNRDVLSKVIV